MEHLLNTLSALTVFSLGTIANADPFFSEAQIAEINSKIENGTYGTVTSVLILHKGETVFEGYYNNANADTHHNLRSVGKTVTGLLVGAAIDDGFISGVNQKAADYFDDLRPYDNPDPRKDAITIERLLTMTSPLECDDFNSFSRGNEERMYIVEDWSSFYWDLPIKNLPSWNVPDNYNGEPTFSYCTAGAQLAGELVERATGQSAQDYAQTRLFNPLGITDPTWNMASNGETHLGGGLELNTQDWAKLGELALNNGRVNGKQILSREFITASLFPHTQADEVNTYGYFWWSKPYKVDGKPHEAKNMAGMGGNRVYVMPDHNVTFVMTKTDYRNGMQAHRETEAFLEDEVVPNL